MSRYCEQCGHDNGNGLREFAGRNPVMLIIAGLVFGLFYMAAFVTDPAEITAFTAVSVVVGLVFSAQARRHRLRAARNRFDWEGYRNGYKY